MKTGDKAPRITVVGCGYWGKNLVRNFAELGALHAVCDADPDLARDFGARFNVPALDLQAALAADSDGIAFASPAALHADHAAMALKAGKHVFIEKPLALTVEDGLKVCDIAQACGRILMVGHLLQYHPLVMESIRIARSGQLGAIRHVISNRLSLGKIRIEEDVIWSFAPHDISVILAIIGQAPSEVVAGGSAFITPGILDIASIDLAFGGEVTAKINVSWVNPYKEQKLSVIGTEGHLVFDDTLAWDDKLTVYRHRVDRSQAVPVAIKGAPEAVIVPQREPLREECAHFLKSIREGTQPRTDANEAISVLATLEAASKAAKTGKPTGLALAQRHFTRHKAGADN